MIRDENMKLRKIISWIIVILPILSFIVVEIFFRRNMFVNENSPVNYLFFVLIECINIIILIYMSLHKFEIKKSILIGIGIYIILSALIPVYCIQETVTPTGENSYLMGLGLKTSYVDIYGINISSIVNLFE